MNNLGANNVANTIDVPKTCGLIIVSPNGWLLGHATTLDHWDLPKGKIDEGETPQQAAIRECWEETGLDLSSHINVLEDLGEAPYNRKRGKRLHLFRLTLDHTFDLSACFCQTIVTTRGAPVPDMDDWAWVPPNQVLELVNRRMGKHLRNRALLQGDIRPKRPSP